MEVGAGANAKKRKRRDAADGKLHMHAALLMYAPAGFASDLKEIFKKQLPAPPNRTTDFCIKEIVFPQTFHGTVGYFQKDGQKAHGRTWSKGMDDAELAKAKNDWETFKSDYMADSTPIHKKNFLQCMWKFERDHLSPLPRQPLITTAMLAIQSGMYFPTETWINSADCLRDIEAAEAYWRLIFERERCACRDWRLPPSPVFLTCARRSCTQRDALTIFGSHLLRSDRYTEDRERAVNAVLAKWYPDEPLSWELTKHKVARERNHAKAERAWRDEQKDAALDAAEGRTDRTKRRRRARSPLREVGSDTLPPTGPRARPPPVISAQIRGLPFMRRRRPGPKPRLDAALFAAIDADRTPWNTPTPIPVAT